MTDEQDNDAQPSGDEAPLGPQCGERLAEARLAQDISVLDVAKELHIGEDKVTALEQNAFENLGAAVFAKGYIRKYSQLVGLDEKELLAEYEQLASASSVVPVLKARPRPRREMSPGPWIAVIVVIILAATAYWWFTERPFGSEVALPGLPAATDPELLDSGVSETLDRLDDEADVVDIAAEQSEPATDAVDTTTGDNIGSTASSEPQPAVEPADDGKLRMLLTFSGDCWTEISDGNGRRLFFGLGSDGRTVELSGEAPFNALFGNAENVRIEVNGDEYVIQDSERRGRTARLTITGP
jgi:cytoskeleton protein RodZ